MLFNRSDEQSRGVGKCIPKNSIVSNVEAGFTLKPLIEQMQDHINSIVSNSDQLMGIPLAVESSTKALDGTLYRILSRDEYSAFVNGTRY